MVHCAEEKQRDAHQANIQKLENVRRGWVGMGRCCGGPYTVGKRIEIRHVHVYVPWVHNYNLEIIVFTV
jgi:hypothetical protein